MCAGWGRDDVEDIILVVYSFDPGGVVVSSHNNTLNEPSHI